MPFFDSLKGLPFWIEDKEEHRRRYVERQGRCCFNHTIGLPHKEGASESEEWHPIYPYEIDIVKALEEHNLLWILKATGLGITELLLRYVGWLCTRDNRYRYQLFAFITGPRQELAEDLISRLKGLFAPHVAFTSAKDTAIINGVKVQAFPSHHLDALRGRNPKFILVDEGDFFPKEEQLNVRPVVERYIVKSRAIIIFVSTPKTPNGLMHTIQKEEPSIYHKIMLYYTAGMPALKVDNFLGAKSWDEALEIIHRENLADKMSLVELEARLKANPEERSMYLVRDVIKASSQPSFNQEYRLQYGFGSGNIFSSKILDKDIIKRYDLDLKGGRVVITVDPAYGSSMFAIAVLEQVGSIIYVKKAEQFARPDATAMIERIANYADMVNRRCKIMVDQARPEIKDGLLRRGYNAVAVDFSKELDRMTLKAVQAVEHRKVAIHPTFQDLIMQLRAITYNDKGHPDKKKNPFDLGDCFMMGVSQFTFGDVAFIDLGKA